MMSHGSRAAFVVVAVAALLASPGAVSAQSGPPQEAVCPFNGHTYRLINTFTTWTAAEAQAVQWGGHLATIRSAQENTWICDTFWGSSYELWIGLNDTNHDRIFTWISGEPVVYTNWGPGEPNNLNGPEDYVQIRWPGAVPGNLVGTWNDTSIDAHGYPCYGVAEIVPEPASLLLLALAVPSLLVRRGPRMHF